MNPFTKQGQALPENVRDRIILLWHAGQIKRQTVTNIVNNFLARGTADVQKGAIRRHARTDGICEYIEYCKQRQPSIFAKEIQDLLVENNICLQQNLPSQSSISRCLRSDLGYSYKKLKVVARESLTPEVQELLDRYLAAVCSVNIRTLHFFDECSVVKTTGNRRYGHSAVGIQAVEVQRYASNATYTVNMLLELMGLNS